MSIIVENSRKSPLPLPVLIYYDFFSCFALLCVFFIMVENTIKKNMTESGLSAINAAKYLVDTSFFLSHSYQFKASFLYQQVQAYVGLHDWIVEQ